MSDTVVTRYLAIIYHIFTVPFMGAMKQRPVPRTPPRRLAPLAVLSVLAAVVVLCGVWPRCGGDLLMYPFIE